jgi:colanic acid/amylovoran biosynthesis protein
LRDELSRRHIEDLGLRLPHVYPAADAAFALADEERVRSLVRKPVNDPIQVAVSVRDWPYFRNAAGNEGMQRYRAAVATTVQHLITARRAKVTFISTCQGIPEYWTDDSRVARQIVDSLPPDVRSQVTVDGDFHTPAQLLDILSGFDLVVATRMHMGILALAAGTPVFPIAYEFKTAELFRNLGLPQWVEDIETLEAAALPSKVERFIQELPGIAPMLVERVLEQRSSALASAAILRRAIEGNRPRTETR